MQILNSTTPHYIRCIKPNADCKAMTFKREEVTLQKPFLSGSRRSLLKTLCRALCWVSWVPCKALSTAHFLIAFSPLELPRWTSFENHWWCLSKMELVSTAALPGATYLLLYEKFLPEHSWVIWGAASPALKIDKGDPTAQQYLHSECPQQNFACSWSLF